MVIGHIMLIVHSVAESLFHTNSKEKSQNVEDEDDLKVREQLNKLQLGVRD